MSALLSGRQHHNYQTVAGRDRDDGDEDDNDDEQQEHDREPDYSGTSERHQSDRPSILREQTKRFIALILVIVALTAAIVVALVYVKPTRHLPDHAMVI